MSTAVADLTMVAEVAEVAGPGDLGERSGAPLPRSDLARRLAASPLAAAGGAMLIDLLDQHALTGLHDEVGGSIPLAQWSDRGTPNDSQRGDPDRSLHHVDGGPQLQALFTGGQLAAVLRRHTGVSWRPLGEQGSYSIYDGGRYLGPHRDIAGCDLTVIVVIHDDTPSGHPLWIWPSRSRADIDDIRREPLPGRRAIVPCPGQAVVLLGGVVPHQVPPMPDGCVRIVAPLCFTPVG